MKEPTARHRKIQSFVLRQGRLTKGQEHAIKHFYEKHVLHFDKDQPFNFESIFNNKNDLVLEIGFGMGSSLAEMAIDNPNKNFLGIEVHLPGVGSLLGQIEREGINNLKISHHDAVEVITHQIKDSSLSTIQIFFPDPWPKKRHQKRRLINQEFLSLILPKLKKGGTIHVATDWEDYANWALEHLNLFSELKNTARDSKFCPRPPFRPLTKFEQRGKRLGHGVWDLIFEKC